MGVADTAKAAEPCSCNNTASRKQMLYRRYEPKGKQMRNTQQKTG
jgi:hypothetical protein